MATDTTLTSYVPYVVARSLAGDPAPITSPSIDYFPAAVLLADISGFTPLAERLAERGPAGAEELTGLLNTYFGQLVDLITAHGGDVLKFAGDALLAIWPAMSEDLATVTRRAAACALAAQATLHGYEVADGVRLSLRIGVGAGDVMLMVVGGEGGRWEVLVAGQPFPEISAAKKSAHPGEVMLHRAAWDLVRRQCLGRVMSDGNVRLNSMRAQDPPRPAEVVTLGSEAETTVRAFLSDAILSRLAAGQNAWLAELRRVSVLFLSIEGIDYGGERALDQVQAALLGMQGALAHYRGTIRQFLVDDKGTVLIAALGLPPRAQEDDAIRAVQAGQMLMAGLERIGLRGSIGIATGRAFCGPVGNALRREYAMVGDVVNLAARLMEAAHGTILCDEWTYDAARARVAFDSLPAISVKGKADPVALYRPRGQARLPVRTQPIVGRNDERDLLLRQVQGLVRGSAGGGVVLIEGEAGIGKSRLVDEVRRWAGALEVRVLLGGGETSETAIPYHAWRPILSKLFRLDNHSDASTRGDRVASLLETGSDLPELAPLLNGLLGLDLHDNETTAVMSPDERAASLHELLVRIMLASAIRSPTVLILEDAQSLDPESWNLAYSLAERQRPGRSPLLVIATRPLTDAAPVGYARLMRSANVQRLTLDALPAAETLLLVCRRLGVGALPDRIAELLLERARGNPFFSEELAYSLRDNGTIQIAGGECRIAPDSGDLRDVMLPDTVHRAIISRIDRLPPRLQLLLKIASVIGRIFPLRALRDIHPISADKELLASDLAQLGRLELTALHAAEPELTYMFKDEVTREVSYNLLLFAQRRELHREVAEWYERTYADNLEPYYSLLADHLMAANETDRALDYLEWASSGALRRFANTEAAGVLRRALELDGESERHVAPLRRATWERHLGESYYRMGLLPESRSHFEAALLLLKKPVPSAESGGRSGEVLSMIGQLVRQGLKREPETDAPVLAARSNLTDTSLVEAIGAYERLAQIHYLNHDVTPGLNAALRALNLAERVGQPTELARGYATAALAVGIVALHARAERYAHHALALAEQTGHLSTLAYVLEMTGTYWAGVGRWDAGRQALSRAAEIAERMGDHRRWEESMANLADIAYYQGRFEESAGLRDRIYTAARGRGMIEGQVWGLIGFLPSLVALDRVTDQSLMMVETLTEDEVAPIEPYGNLAVVLLHRNELVRARQLAESALALMVKTRPTTHYSLSAYAGVAEVFLMLVEGGHYANKDERRKLLKGVRDACAALAGFTRIFPIGEPRLLLWQGLLQWHEGQRGRAVQNWNRSVAAAERLGMTYDEARARYELARHLGASDPGHQDNMAHAFNLFNSLGAAYDLGQIQHEG